MDLTSLGDNDTEVDISKLIAQGRSNSLQTPPAAFCIYSKFTKAAKENVEGMAKIATVVNFPNGSSSEEEFRKEMEAALAENADEIDIVVPYAEYMEHGSSEHACKLVAIARDLCKPKGVTLKVIIESGCLEKPGLIERASEDAVKNGANFIKTSTGKVKVGATLEAAKVMLEVIKRHSKEHDYACGFKASGGVRTYDDAVAYLELAESILGADFLKPELFRFGVSGLLANLLKDAQELESGEVTNSDDKTDESTY